MKIYKVKVNGKVYEVELESVSEVQGSVETPAPIKNGEGYTFLAPIGGKVIDLKVKVGDTVKKGDLVAIIEAMKLENEIRIDHDGVIGEIKVNKGAVIENKAALLILK